MGLGGKVTSSIGSFSSSSLSSIVSPFKNENRRCIVEITTLLSEGIEDERRRLTVKIVLKASPFSVRRKVPNSPSACFQDYFGLQETTLYALVYKKASGRQQDKQYMFYPHRWQEPSTPDFARHGNSFQVLSLPHIGNHAALSFQCRESGKCIFNSQPLYQFMWCRDIHDLPETRILFTKITAI